MSTRRPPRLTPAFTLAELLVVIAIIVILIGILIPAVGTIRRKSKDMASQAQLDSIGKANEQYKLAFLSYAGPIGDAYWDDTANRPLLTSNENLVLGLLGRVIYSNTGNTTPISALHATSNTPAMWLDLDKLGSGPQSRIGQSYGAFYPVKTKEMATVLGTTGTQNDLPELVDVSYGLPILYFRARGGWAIPVTEYYGANSPNFGAFSLAPVVDYVESAGLTVPGQSGMFPQSTSLLNKATSTPPSITNAVNNLAWLVINTKLSDLNSGTDPKHNDSNDVPKAGFFLMSSGYDRVYLAKDQGDKAPSVDGKIDNEFALTQFDDIIVSGGTAP